MTFSPVFMSFLIYFALVYHLGSQNCLAAESERESKYLPENSNNLENIELTPLPGHKYGIIATVGGQRLTLLVSSVTEGIILFEDGTDLCNQKHPHHCYVPTLSRTAVWCNNSEMCIPGKAKFKCIESSSPKDIKPNALIGLKADGYRCAVFTLEGSENVSIVGGDSKTQFGFEKIPVKLGKSFFGGEAKEIFGDVDGIFGISGPELGCRNLSIWNEILKKYSGSYMIDINGFDGENLTLGTEKTVNDDEKNNRIILGIDTIDKSKIIWSERRQVGGIYDNSLLGFSIYGLTMCDVEVFGKMSSYWEVLIDLSSECLILPQNFWITVMTYLPIDEGCLEEVKSYKMCKLKKGVVGPLPTLEFRFKQDQSSEKLSIPLENLLKTTPDSGHRSLCILPDEDRLGPRKFTLTPTIKFGHKVLESMNVIVDSSGHRLGFLQKKLTVVSNSKCSKQKTCIGDQVYEPALNYCMDPLCSLWIFKRLNKETRVCETSPVAVWMFTLVMATMLSLEVICQYSRRRAIQMARQLC